LSNRAPAAADPDLRIVGLEEHLAAGEHRLRLGGCGFSEALNRFPRIMSLWSIDPDQPKLHLPLAVALNPNRVTVDDLRDQVRPRRQQDGRLNRRPERDRSRTG
jgi:hypothetical protein